MAGGKLSPRQKMINLMYLVFIAMLAMQMDKKVLSSFGFMKEKAESANTISERNISNILSSLNVKATDQPDKYKVVNDKATQIHTLSENLFNTIKRIKDSMMVDIDEEDKENYESMSGADKVDELFFAGEKYTPLGQQFVDGINAYKTDVLSILGNTVSPEIINNINKRFDTSPDTSEDGIDIPWLISRYEGMPLITSIANVTQIQQDIRTTESEVYTTLLGGQLESEVSLTNYTGIVRLNKTAYFSGERVTGEVVLGRYDATLVPDKVMMNGTDITKNAKNGQVLLDMPSGNVGDKSIKGIITFTQDGQPINVPFESKYSVISQPDEAVISADRMNVVYRGLDNPISISLPGVGDKDINASATGLKKVSTGKYIMRPGAANEVEITVSGKISPTKTVTSKKTFRIKDIPAAMGTVRGEFGIVPMPKSSLLNAPIGAGLPDFVFDLKLNVQGFTIKVPGQLAVKVQGSALDNRAKTALAKARRGDVITIFDIKATIVNNSSYQLKKVLPVSIEITN